MRICENGIYRDMTKEEIAELNSYTPEPAPYEQRVVSRVRERYSIDDELAILRQRNTKPEEFEQYNAYVERIKAEERAVT